LCSADAPNLFAAGRTLDADTDAFASLRVMGTAFATGHAAGIAAAQYAETRAIDIGRLRAELRRQDALVDAPGQGVATKQKSEIT
jgi:hypothetical protein